MLVSKAPLLHMCTLCSVVTCTFCGYCITALVHLPRLWSVKDSLKSHSPGKDLTWPSWAAGEEAESQGENLFTGSYAGCSKRTRTYFLTSLLPGFIFLETKQYPSTAFLFVQVLESLNTWMLSPAFQLPSSSYSLPAYLPMEQQGHSQRLNEDTFVWKL